MCPSCDKVALDIHIIDSVIDFCDITISDPGDCIGIAVVEFFFISFSIIGILSIIIVIIRMSGQSQCVVSGDENTDIALFCIGREMICFDFKVFCSIKCSIG